MAGLADIVGAVQGAGGPPGIGAGPPGMGGPPGMAPNVPTPPREVMIQMIMFLLSQMQQGGQGGPPSLGAGPPGMPPGPPGMPPPPGAGGGLPF